MARKGSVQSIETSFLPRETYANDLDRRALNLCRIPTKSVLLYSGSPFLAQKSRISLFAHNIGLERFFIRQPLVASVFNDRTAAAPGAYNFVANTMPKFVRHDMAELFKEPQTFYQKTDPALKKWKPDLEAYNIGIVQAQYHMAQIYTATGRDEDFLNLVSGIQNELRDYEAVTTQLKGPSYRHYIETTFNNALTVFLRRGTLSKVMLSTDTKSLIDANDAMHMRHYNETENPEQRLNSPEGLMTKLIDKNHDQYTNYGRWKLENPTMPGLTIDREGSHLFICTVARAEEYLGPFLTACDNDTRSDDLGPFKDMTYGIVYKNLHDYALLAAPVIQMDPLDQKAEPTVMDKEQVFRAFYEEREKMLLGHRASVHPLEDRYYQSSLELAAKALTFHQTNQLTLQGLLNNEMIFPDDFKQRFEKNLDQLSHAKERRAVS